RRDYSTGYGLKTLQGERHEARVRPFAVAEAERENFLEKLRVAQTAVCGRICEAFVLGDLRIGAGFERIRHAVGRNPIFVGVMESVESVTYQISATLKTNPGRIGSPLTAVGFSRVSAGMLGR